MEGATPPRRSSGSFSAGWPRSTPGRGRKNPVHSDASSDSGSMRILKVADVRGSGIGGINSFMRKTGAELVRQGHRVDYLFQEDLGPRLIPHPLRRLLVPWLITWKVFRRQRRGAGYDAVEIHEWCAGAY